MSEFEISKIHISELTERIDLDDKDVLPLDTNDERTLKVKAETIKEYVMEEVDSEKIDISEKGAANGVATLDENGLIPSAQLPSYVDDVKEGTAVNPTQTAAGTFSASGFILLGESEPCVLESGKTYVDTTSNIQYRWTGTGTNLVSMGSNLSLGETQYTAYPGNMGKANADAIQSLQSTKVDKVAGKGLSTNDYTTAEKNKLAEITAAEDYAEDSEAHAKGTRGGIPVPSTDETYHNNSKYYAEQAEAYAGNAVRRNELVDTVGWTGKNLIPYPYQDGASKTQRGVTYTVNGEGDMSLSGTCNNSNHSYFYLATYQNVKAGTYIVTGCNQVSSSDSGIAVYKATSVSNYLGIDKGNGFQFTLESDSPLCLAIRIYNNQNATGWTFKPMLRHADIIDDTFEPYHKNVLQLMDHLEETGVKNLVDVRGECVTTSELNGLRYSYNDDGSVRIYGTHTISSGNSKFTFAGIPILNPGRYKFSLGIAAKGDCGVYLNNSARSLGDSYTYKGQIIKDSSTPLTFEITDSDVATYKYLYFQIVISGALYTGELDFMFKPMFYPADSSNDDFQKFAMTNQELSEKYFPIEQIDGYISHNYLENNLPSYIPISQGGYTIRIYVNEDKSLTLNGGPFSSSKVAFYNFAEPLLPTGLRTTSSHLPEGRYKLIIKDANGNTVTSSVCGFVMQLLGTDDITKEGTILGTSTQRYAKAFGFKYYYVRLVISGIGRTYDNETFYLMVLPAGCTDETYKPYVKNNEQLQEEINGINNYMGSKNIFDYTKWEKHNYKNGTGTCVDGEYTISVPADYENNSGIYLACPSEFYSKYNFENVRVSLDIKGDDIFRVNLGYGGITFISSYPVSTEWVRVWGITPFSNTLRLYIQSTTETGSPPHTLYIRNIMITEASITDEDTYAPYAKTNRDLTLDKAETTDLAPVENAATASKAYATGAYIERPDGLYKVTADIASGGTFTVRTNISKVTVGEELSHPSIPIDPTSSEIAGFPDGAMWLVTS